jgi:uncharacterized OsmC-like protein
MKLSASIHSKRNHYKTFVQANESVKEIRIGQKLSGLGSSITGGELLLLSLATCFCNNIYREAAKRNIEISAVEVEVTGHFGADGEPGSNFKYNTRITSDSSQSEIEDLVNYTDKVAEVHNTLRKGVSIQLIN